MTYQNLRQIPKDTAEKELVFLGRAEWFVRFSARSEVNGSPWTSAAEINILGVPK